MPLAKSISCFASIRTALLDKELILVRHAEALHCRSNVFMPRPFELTLFLQGQHNVSSTFEFDPPLTAVGQRQVDL